MITRPNKLHLLADIFGRVCEVVKAHPEAVAEISKQAAHVFANWADRETDYQAWEDSQRENRR